MLELISWENSDDNFSYFTIYDTKFEAKSKVSKDLIYEIRGKIDLKLHSITSTNCFEFALIDEYLKRDLSIGIVLGEFIYISCTEDELNRDLLSSPFTLWQDTILPLHPIFKTNILDWNKVKPERNAYLNKVMLLK